MIAETSILALRLEGPMQSWGYDSQFNRRNTALFPTKSALAGLCCAAMGLPRGSQEEKEALEKMAVLKLLCIAVSRNIKNKEIIVERIQDYHTVMGTRDAKGGIKNDAVLTYRQYLNDASFIALLEGEKEFLLKLTAHLKNPTWGIWLGRKACIPSAPVFAGRYESEEEALKALFPGKTLDDFTYQREVTRFEDGRDSLMDQALCFGAPGKPRKYVPRRVILHDAKV